MGKSNHAGRTVPSPVAPKMRTEHVGKGQRGAEFHTSDVAVLPTADPSPLALGAKARGPAGGEFGRVRRGDGAAGFTLIETLVALVIFVAGYLLVHRSVSLGWRGAQVAWAESGALRLARSRLDAAGLEQRLGEGEWSGETDGYSWTLRSARYHRPGTDDGPRKMAAYWVTVTVRWNGGVLRPARSLQLKTLKIGVRP